MNDQEKARRGERARQLLKDPLIEESLETLRRITFGNIASSHYSKVEEREDLYKMLQAIKGFENNFKKIMRDGELAKSRLEQLKDKFKR
ncbi:MAG: hypothetical protein JKY48_01545 [Flavobacteriales bacterium]|nr:hypothetical protein [Flavobacteriales bacterium]